MKDFKFTCVPKNLMLALDGNCKVMLFTLVQYSDFTAGEDGWFYAPNATLQTQAGLSKNLVIATLDTLYQAGVIDIECIGVGTGRKSNRIKVNTTAFDKYDEYKVEDILGNPELQIRTVQYKNNYSPSYLQGGKKECKKVNTIIDNIDNIDNKEIKEDNKSVLYNIGIEERENLREKEKPSQVVVESGKTEVKRDLMKLEDAYQLPDMEKRLELQYQYVLKDLPALQRKRYDFSENCYLQETIDWVEATEDYPVLTNCMLRWYDGGRKKLSEMVQGLDPKVTKDVMVYLVLSCIAYDAQDEENRYSAVYSA